MKIPTDKQLQDHYPRINNVGKCDICGGSESQHKLKLNDLIIEPRPVQSYDKRKGKSMSISEIFERLDYFEDYLAIRIDIISNYPSRWLGPSYNELPLFEYYLKNVINDVAGPYDFTVRRYKSVKQTLTRINVEFESKGCELSRYMSYSRWMGTPFNFQTHVSFS